MLNSILTKTISSHYFNFITIFPNCSIFYVCRNYFKCTSSLVCRRENTSFTCFLSKTSTVLGLVLIGLLFKCSYPFLTMLCFTGSATIFGLMRSKGVIMLLFISCSISLSFFHTSKSYFVLFS